MKIDFNNVRRKAIVAYCRLVSALNNRISEDKVIIHVSELEDAHHLRQALIAIACTYEKGDDNFKCILGDNDNIPIFNEKE